MDFKNLGAKRVCVVTDSTVAKLDAIKHSIMALREEDVEFTIYDKVRVEPKDYSSVSPVLPLPFRCPFGGSRWCC